MLPLYSHGNKYYILHFSLIKHQRIIVSPEESDYEIRMKLVSVHDAGYRLIIMHSTPIFFQRHGSKQLMMMDFQTFKITK